MEMLVDHYPLRRLVERGRGTDIPPLHTARLLAEAMAGGEVLVLCGPDGPIGLTIEDQTLMVVGTSAAYERSSCVQALAHGRSGGLRLDVVDSRQAVIAAAVSGFDGIVFDLDPHRRGVHDMAAALQDSLLPVDAALRASIVPLVSESPDLRGSLLPPHLTAALARSTDPEERRDCLKGYLKSCGPEALGSIVVHLPADGREGLYSTFARFVADALEQVSGEEPQVAIASEVVKLTDVLQRLAEEGGVVQLDGASSISGRTATAALKAAGLDA